MSRVYGATALEKEQAQNGTPKFHVSLLNLTNHYHSPNRQGNARLLHEENKGRGNMEKTGWRLSATSWSMDVISPTILYPLFIIETCYQLSRGTAVIKLQALNNFCSALTAMFGAHHQRGNKRRAEHYFGRFV